LAKISQLILFRKISFYLADDRGLCYAASRSKTHFTDLMPYFFLSLTLPDGNVNPQIWEITDTVAYRVGVTNSESSLVAISERMLAKQYGIHIRKNTSWFESTGINPYCFRQHPL